MKKLWYRWFLGDFFHNIRFWRLKKSDALICWNNLLCIKIKLYLYPLLIIVRLLLWIWLYYTLWNQDSPSCFLFLWFGVWCRAFSTTWRTSWNLSSDLALFSCSLHSLTPLSAASFTTCRWSTTSLLLMYSGSLDQVSADYGLIIN